MHFREREKLEAKRLIEEETYTEGDVLRWKSNDQVPPGDVLRDAGVSVELQEACRVARDNEVSEFLARYREAMSNHVPSDEERFEMRAAFGEGREVVNVITGQKFRT